MTSIAFFDFDGTLTTRDTMVDFTRYTAGNAKFTVGILFLSPLFMLVLLKVLPRNTVARHFIRFFYKNKNLQVLQDTAIRYTNQRLPGLMNKKVYNAFLDHQRSRHKVVIVSASLPLWLEPWCRQQGVDLLATPFEVKNGRLTGRLPEQRCNNQHKVTRIKQAYKLSDYDRTYAYGNSHGDKAMIDMVDAAFFVKKGSLVTLKP